MDSAAGPLLSYRQIASVDEWSVGDEVRCGWDAASAVVVEPERT